MKKVVVVILLLLAGSAAGTKGTARAPVNSVQEDSITEQVDRLFEKWKGADSPGCAVGVIKDARMVYEHGYGIADLEHNVPITPRTLFDIGSVAKQFTAMSVLLLAQQGKISLADDIHKYIPEVPDYGAKITLRHLLYHTSGLRNHFLLYQLSGWRWGDLESTEDALDTVARQRELNFEPGTGHSYTNTGYLLLGEVVHRVARVTLREFVTRNIFQPLGMNDSQIHDDVSLVMRNRAWGYNLAKNGTWVNNITRSEEVGDSNVYTTIEDFARWNLNFYDKKVGGDAVVAEMLKPGSLNSGRVLNYAAGLRLEEYKGLKVVRHAGSSTSRAEYLQFPDQHFAVLCFCNSGAIDSSTLAQRVADIYLADFLKPEPRVEVPSPEKQAKNSAEVQAFSKTHAINLSPAELSKFAGFYVNTDNGNRRHLLMKSGKLMFERRPGVESELVPIAPNRFVMADIPEKLEIWFEERSPQFRVMLVSSGENTTPLALVYAGDDTTASPSLSEYSGTFQSDEADAVVGFVIRDGKLILHTRKFAEPKTPGSEEASRGWYPLEPVCADSFKNDWIGLLKFTRDSHKQVTGFFISNFAGGVRHLQFKKKQA